MSIALIAGIVVVFIAIMPHFIKTMRATKRSPDTSGDGGTAVIDSGSTSTDCASDGGGDGGCD